MELKKDRLPAGWSASTIGAEFDVQLGKKLDHAKNSGVLKPYVGNKEVRWARVVTSALPSTVLDPVDLKRLRLLPGDLLVCEGGEVGRAALWTEARECYFQNTLYRLRSLRGYDPRFLLALFEFWDGGGALTDFIIKTSIAHITRDKFVKVPLLVPPPAEQRAIAAALSDVDALIAALDALIAKKRATKTAAMQQLLTGRQRLPGFSGEWTTTRMGALGATYGGITGKSKKDFGCGVARYIPFMNVMANVTIDPGFLEQVDIQESEGQNRVARGDLLFNTSSETPGELAMCAAVTGDLGGVYLNSFCFGFRSTCRLWSPLYLAYYFRGTPGRNLMYSMAQGATRYNVSKRSFLGLEIDLPNFEEQEAIAAILSDMDAEIAALEARRDKTRHIKTGMMQELLTGRTRLI